MQRIHIVLWVFVGIPLAAQEGVRVHRDIPYMEREGVSLGLDLHLPQGQGPHPAVIVVHGGGWRIGSKSSNEAKEFCRLLAEDGLAAVSIGYRLVPKHTHPAQIDDCRAAVSFVRERGAEVGIDVTRLAVIGASAGGHLAALLACDRGTSPQTDSKTEAPKFRCVVALFAPMVFEVDGTAPPLAVRIVSDFLGGFDPAKPADLQRAREAAPITHVDSSDPPFLLIHGTKDPLVSLSHSERMKAALLAVKVSCDLVTVEGGSHGDFLWGLHRKKPDAAPAFWQSIRKFMDGHLRPEKANPLVPAPKPEVPKD